MVKYKHLQHFVGKVCTLFTHPINRNFKEENPQTFQEQPYYYFVGVIDAVDEGGILVTQVLTGLKSYFFMDSLVSIAEEEVLDPDNEADANIINEMKTQNEEVRNKLKLYEEKKDDFVDPDEMALQLRKLQEKNK